MTPEEISMFSSWRVVIAIVISSSAAVVFVIISLVCLYIPCCRRHESDEEQILRGSVHQNPRRKESAIESVKEFTMKMMGKEPIDRDIPHGVDYQLGKIQIALTYIERHTELNVKLLRAADLPMKDWFGGVCDPYASIQVLPDKKKEFKTKRVRGKLDPVWNESFQFQGWTRGKLSDKTLLIQVSDYDRFTKNEPIGEIFLTLNMVDLNNNDPLWYFLQPCKDSKAARLGELLVSLCYDPKAGRLMVKIIRARDVKAKDLAGASDPYVKVFLYVNGKIIEKRKTGTKRSSTNPVYDESFTFHLAPDKLTYATVECIMMDYDKYTSDDRIGHVFIGPRSSPAEKRHWNEMRFHPMKEVPCWHVLI